MNAGNSLITVDPVRIASPSSLSPTSPRAGLTCRHFIVMLFLSNCRDVARLEL
jgi:hypothetical protein